MPDIGAINNSAVASLQTQALAQTNARNNVQDLREANLEQERINQDRLNQERASDPQSLERAFNELQQSTEQRTASSGLAGEPQGRARQASQAYADTEGFLQRDQLNQLVGFDGFA